MIRRNPGFTIIELLTVIAILAVLAAVLFPVFAAAREQARKSTCASNLRQIGIAIQSYVQDWDGCYPNTDNPSLWMGRFWRWPLKPYLSLMSKQVDGDPLHSTGDPESILMCPSDMTAKQSFDNTSYAYSMCFYVDAGQIDSLHSFSDTVTPPGPPCSTQNESSVAFPAQKAIVTEWTSNHASPHVGWSNPKAAWEGARMYLFADGHCKYLKSRQILPANDGLPDINLTHGGIAGKDVH